MKKTILLVVISLSFMVSTIIFRNWDLLKNIFFK